MVTNFTILGAYMKITWPDDKFHYLSRRDGYWRYNESDTHINIIDQFEDQVLAIPVADFALYANSGVPFDTLEGLLDFLSNNLSVEVIGDSGSQSGNMIQSDVAKWTGWAQYSDSLYNSSNKFVLTQGAVATLPNNGVGSIESELPEDATSFYDAVNRKILGVNSGDFFIGRINLKASTDNNNGIFLLSLDIGGTQGVIFEKTIDFPRGTSTTRNLSVIVPYYTFPTFLANGGELKVEGINGTTSLWDISYLIDRTHKSRQ